MPPSAGAPISVEQFIGAIARYRHFANPELVDASGFDPRDLPARERRWFMRILAPYASYFARDPRFDDRQARTLTGLTAPPADEGYMTRLIDFAIHAGFLPSMPQRISG